MYILGISAYYHDSAACIIYNDKIIAAAQEERFTRKKQDSSFPTNAIQFCLQYANINIGDIEAIAFYDKPLLKFERLLDSYFDVTPRGIKSFLTSMPVWIKEKMFMKKVLYDELDKLNEGNSKIRDKKILFPEHHLSHAASAFYPSPYAEAAILTIDGVGEYATTAFGYGENNEITFLSEIQFPHSLGLLYSAFTYYLGFKVNSGEYKVMGLAPYGEPKYKDIIYTNLLDVKPDGSFLMNMDYFNYTVGLTMTNEKFDKLFDLPKRAGESELTQKHMDIAASLQKVTEEIVLKICRHIAKETGKKNLVMAGGVALNCVANGKIYEEKIFDNIWIQPASGDAGGALGAALAAYHIYYQKPRIVSGNNLDSMSGSYLGPEYRDNDVLSLVNKYGAVTEKQNSFELLASKTAKILSEGNVIGWFQGRMEFGPRALGNRSIIGDARNPEMQKKMNLKIKFRESFRPFAPIVLAEDVNEYFEFDGESPYMLLVAPVKASRRKAMTAEEEKLFGIEKLNVSRSDLPGVTHVDYSARLQTVNEPTNAKLYKLLTEFKQLSGHSVLINTSFNVRGEPIVNTPEDAYRCFMRTEMDYLIIDNYVFSKTEQPNWKEDSKWEEEFTLD